MPMTTQNKFCQNSEKAGSSQNYQNEHQEENINLIKNKNNILKKLSKDFKHNVDYLTICEVCLNDFNAHEKVPKILDCGHSFCFLCLEKVFETSKKCPKCSKYMTWSKNLKDYSTNFSLLESLKLVKLLRKEYILPAEIKEKLIVQKETLTKKRAKISAFITSAEPKVDELQHLIDSENLDLNEANRVTSEIANISKTLDKEFQPNFKNIKGSVDIKLKSYKNTEGYLIEIYDRLRNDEKIYTVKKIEKVVKYGKVSSANNLILFHSLSETEKPDSASLIWFDDLKNCVTEKNFLTFLKLSCNEKGIVQLITIKMCDIQLSSKFIKLCTGECGPSYKGCQYEQYIKDGTEEPDLKPILGVVIPPNKNFADVVRIEYNQKDLNNIKCHKGDDLIFLNDEGTFAIANYLLSYKHYSNYFVGKVESPRNVADFISFSDPSKLKILDCGIAFKF